MSGKVGKVAAGMLVYRWLEEFQYLILQTSYGRHHWTPPKGHVDPGENNEQTAIRETEEESGLTPNDYEVDRDFDPIVLKYDVKGAPKTVYYWLARLKNPQTPIKLSEEHKDFKWVNLDKAVEIMNDFGFQSQAESFRRADSYLKAKFKDGKFS